MTLAQSPLEALAKSKKASGDIMLTVSFGRADAWRTLLFATGRKVADHKELLELRDQIWKTIPSK